MILFDFDGVLINSLDEVVLTTFNTISGSLTTSLDQVPESYATLFRKFRFYVQPAGDFIPYAEWCLANAGTWPDDRWLSFVEFQGIIANTTQSLGERSALFFLTRDKFVKQDKLAWLSLHRPYQPLWGTLQQLDPQLIVILTNKNRDAVVDLCTHFNLNIFTKNIYTADHGATKLANFEHILRRFGSTSYSFIDDSVLNLQEFKVYQPVANIELILATWGYVGPEDTALAKSLGFNSLTQAEFISQLGQIA